MKSKPNFQHVQHAFFKTSQLLMVCVAVLSMLLAAWQPARTAPLAAPKDAALQFDGTDDFVDFGEAAGTDNLGLQVFTIETWFKRTGAGTLTNTGTLAGGIAAVPLVTKGRGEAENSNKDMNYFFGIDSTGVLAADFEECATSMIGCPATASNVTAGGQNYSAKAATVIQLNTWYHAAVTFDGRYWTFYLNGVQDGASTDTGEIRLPRWDSIQHAALGSALTSNGLAGGFFNGILDEVRIWNVVRTPAEIAANMNNELTGGTGLIARWGLNEGTGLVAANSIAGRPDGTLTNGPLWYAVDVTPPAAPTSLTATPYNGAVDLNWTAPADLDVAGYNIYRSTSPSVPLTSPINGGSLVTATTYADNGLVNTTQYYYVVTAVDTSVNESQASNEANATPLAGLGNGVGFDGVNDNATFGAAPALGLQHFTVETWFKRTGTGTGIITDNTNGVTAVPLVTKGSPEGDGTDTDENYILGIRPSDNVLAADFENFAACDSRPAGDNNPLVGVTPVANNTWYHAAFTYDGAVMKLYLNGNLEGSLANTCLPRYDSIQYAGLGSTLNSTGTASGFFKGVLDEVRIWNYARSRAEIVGDINHAVTSGTGLVARWGLNEGVGTSITSSVGSFPGILRTGPFWTTGTPFNLSLPTVCHTLNVTHTGQGAALLATPANSIGCPAGKYEAGESISLSGAAADTGWHISGWTGTINNASTASSNTVTMPDSDRDASVIYTQDEYTLTIVSANGTVTRNPVKGTYHYNDVVQLTAAPDAGWTFVNWSGGLTGSTNPDLLTIHGNTTVTANYSQNEYTLTIIAVNGTVAKAPAQATYHYNDVVQLTATPDAGAVFVGWSGGLTGSTNPDSLTILGNTTVTASFLKVTTLVVSPASGTYGGTANLSATLTFTHDGSPVSGKTILFSLNGTAAGSASTNASGVATINSASLSGIQAGSYPTGLSASFAGDTIYKQSTDTAGLVVNKRNVSVKADAKTKFVGDADPALTYQITSGSLVSPDTFTGALTRAPGETIGTYAIQQGTLALSANYILSYSGANLSIIAHPNQTIRGTVGVGGASLSFTGGTPVISAADGSYTISVPYDWSGTVTPSKLKHIFTPANRSYTNLKTNLVGQNYTPTAVPAIPTTISPNGLITNAKPTYAWYASPGATSYRLAVYNVTKNLYVFNNLVVPATACTGTPKICRFTPAVTLSNHTFKFGVAAVNAAGNSGYAPLANWRTFTVRKLAVFTSAAAQDGFIQESTETSERGGVLSATTTLRVGDDALDRQYRSILSFSTGGLPDNAVIVSATLKLKKSAGSGIDPFTTHGALWVDILKGWFGNGPALELVDFQTPPSVSSGGVVGKTPVSGFYLSKLTTVGMNQINKIGITQMRLRFNLGDNDNLRADWVAFFAGESLAANRPVLEIVYYIP